MTLFRNEKAKYQDSRTLVHARFESRGTLKGSKTLKSLLPDPAGAEGYATDIKYNVIAE